MRVSTPYLASKNPVFRPAGCLFSKPLSVQNGFLIRLFLVYFNQNFLNSLVQRSANAYRSTVCWTQRNKQPMSFPVCLFMPVCPTASVYFHLGSLLCFQNWLVHDAEKLLLMRGPQLHALNPHRIPAEHTLFLNVDLNKRQGLLV